MRRRSRTRRVVKWGRRASYVLLVTTCLAGSGLIVVLGFSSKWKTVVFPALTLALVSTVVFVLISRRDSREIPPGHCQRCGYNLTGLPEARCPECGNKT